MPKLTLNDVTFATSSQFEDTLTNWAKQNKIKLQKTGENQYKILNGCIKNIMFYPTKWKLMFQTQVRNYVITSETEDSVVGLIKGDIDFKRGDDE